MANSTIILYDLPCKGRNSCWSLNPWKSRLVLNYKGLDYKTQWLEYPDIKSTLSSLGITPNPVAGPQYSIPAITLPSSSSAGNEPKQIMESSAIASALEAAYPSPSLQLDHPIREQVQKLVFKVLKPLLPEVLPLIPKEVLSEGSMEYWGRTRTENFGDLDTWHKEKGGEQAWDAAKEGLEETAALLRKEGGPFFLGEEPCYADFIWVGLVQFVRRASEEGWEKFAEYEEIRKQYEGCQKWMERDN